MNGTNDVTFVGILEGIKARGAEPMPWIRTNFRGRSVVNGHGGILCQVSCPLHVVFQGKTVIDKIEKIEPGTILHVQGQMAVANAVARGEKGVVLLASHLHSPTLGEIFGEEPLHASKSR